jgi:hypothetical protein
MKFDGGLILTAGTLNPQLPRKAIPSVEISVWLKFGQAFASEPTTKTD